MLFTGHSDHQIDSKCRLAIPAKHRARLAAGPTDGTSGAASWYCVPWPGGVLRLYPSSTFERLSAQAESTLTPGADEADLEANLFGFAELLEMDAQGRVPIPRQHLELVGLSSPHEVVIVGARNRLEVRDRGAWKASEAERFARLPSLVERVDERKARRD